MRRIETKLDIHSDEFRANAAHNETVIAELRARQQAEPEVAEHLQTLLDFLDVASRGIIRP